MQRSPKRRVALTTFRITANIALLSHESDFAASHLALCVSPRNANDIKRSTIQNYIETETEYNGSVEVEVTESFYLHKERKVKGREIASVA